MKPASIVRRIKEFEGAQFIAIEEVYPYTLLRRLTVNGIGIIVNPLPSRIYNKFYRGNFEKRGSIIRFTDVPVYHLEEFRDNILFLVNEAKVAGTEMKLDPLKLVFVAEYELVRMPEKLKYRFEPWRFYTGDIKYGKKVWRVKWMVRVPTRDSRTVMFLGSREDEHDMVNIVFKYTHMKYGNRVLSRGEFPVAILFS